MISKIKMFTKHNKWIAVGFVIAVSIIFSYIASMNLPEWFPGAEICFNLFFQLSIGFIISFIFYIMQVYIPSRTRTIAVNKCIKKRVEQILAKMNASITTLGHVYLNNHTGDKYTNDELEELMKLKFSDKVRAIDAATGKYFTVREWISKCIAETESEIDKLYKYYPADISIDLMAILEEILRCAYHSSMKLFCHIPNDVNFSESNANLFLEYYNYINDLKDISEKDYS